MPRLTSPRRRTIPGPVTRGQRPDKPPLRPRDMKDSKSRKRRSRGMRAEANGRDESPAELIAGYTPKQREAYLKGLRILAKVAVRAHKLREKAAGRDPDAIVVIDPHTDPGGRHPRTRTRVARRPRAADRPVQRVPLSRHQPAGHPHIRRPTPTAPPTRSYA